MSAWDLTMPKISPDVGGGHHRRRRSWFSPGRTPVAYHLAVQVTTPPDQDVDTAELETLTLTHFTCAPKVDFGTLRIGKSSQQHIRVVNPHDYEQTVVVEKFPYKRNFSISDTEFTVPAESELLLTIMWHPTELGNYREMVLFKVDGVFRLQATLMGKLEKPPKPKKVKKTWTNKPAVPAVRGVLRACNRGNVQPILQPKSTKLRTPPDVASRRVTWVGENAMPQSKTAGPALMNMVPTTYTNPQVPLNMGALFIDKLSSSAEPVDSPDSAHSTFEKSFPEMPNTPVISVRTPPQSKRDKVLQPRRIVVTPKPLSPLATMSEDQENLPPFMFADDDRLLTKAKLRRSNTYTKLNDSSPRSPELGNLHSSSDSASSSADMTVLERTEVTGCIEVMEQTEVCEEVIEFEETVEYLIEGDPSHGGKQTEVARSVQPVGRQFTKRDYESTYINDSQVSVPATPRQGTFVKSPLAATPGVMSATQVLSPRRTSMSNSRESFPLPYHNMTSGTQVMTPPPVSTRCFFSDLLARHDGKPSHEPTQGVADKLDDARVKLQHAGISQQKDFISDEPFQNVLNPRRFSTLTVTKVRQSIPFSPTENELGSMATALLSPQRPAKEGRCLFMTPQSKHPYNSPDSPGVIPLVDSPVPCRTVPNKINIQGTNYPGSRSLRNMDDDWAWQRSPRKGTTPHREKTRRRTSGQFRRRISLSQANGFLVASGLGLRDDDEDSDTMDLPMSRSELSNGYAESTDVQIRSPSKPQVASNLVSLPSYARPTAAITRRKKHLSDQDASVKSAQMQTNQHQSIVAPKLADRKPVVAALKNPVLQRRKDTVSENKKSDLGVNSRRSERMEKLRAPKQEPVSKRPVRDATTAQSLVTGLTKAPTLRRDAAPVGVTKPEKKAVPRLKPKVAQSKLRLIRATTKTALPKHPMAFAAKNIYYDERWMEKQDRGFVRWLNFVLTPHEEECNGPTKPQTVDAGALAITANNPSGPQLAPTRETLSYRVYSARRRLNKLRRAACRLFTSDTMVRFHHKLEVEVECGRIMVRSDRKIHADVGIKQCILDLLLSYNPLWLRIGLEAVYGEVLPITSNADIMGTSRFILTRLLGNPDIAAEFAHPCVPHLYRDGYDKRLAQFSLKLFILLVVFLDYAKTLRLIDHDPCLFCRDSDFKASREVLLAFSRNYLSGEGDLSRHLSYMGYGVSHVQTPLDELDYAVKNLAVDLRDGTRLTRVVAMLAERWALTNELRVPAVSRLQKVHNIGIAFRELKAVGLELSTVKGRKIDPRDIADGHREKTLHLLWQLIFKFQVDILLNETQLRDEIRFLLANFYIKRQFDAICNDDIETLGIPEERRETLDTDLYYKSPRLGLLLTWCRAVCAYYGVKVENFTVSFSDGRALCYLIHHYHPGLLPLADIRTETTQTTGPGNHNASGTDSENDDSFDSPWGTFVSPTIDNPAFWEELLANERENFRLLYERVNELGNIPVMIRASDMSNTIPDEKVVITYVTYLCARLLDIRLETRAARIIQVAWRRHCLRKQEEQFKVRCEAALKIQHAVRQFLERRRQVRRVAAAIIIQAGVRGMLARRHAAWLRLQRRMANMMVAVITIQAYVRSWLTRRSLQRRALAAVQIQSWWRMESARRSFLCQQYAATIIQQYYRACRKGADDRACFLTLRVATLHIQAYVRSWLVRRNLRRQQAGAVRIQAWWRMMQYRRTLRRHRDAAVTIQRYLRAHIAARRDRAWYLSMKASALILQRAFVARKLSLAVRRCAAATVIQKQWRAYVTFQEYNQMRFSALRIQTWFRANHARRSFCLIRNATICVQAHVRGWLVRRSAERKHSAAVVVQAWWRGVSTRRVFLCKREAAVTIQCFFHAVMAARRDRRHYLALRTAAVTIQRAFIARKVRILLRQESAAITIQTYWRARVARKQYSQARHSALTIQSWLRAVHQRRNYIVMRSAAVRIQRCVRAWSARQSAARQGEAAIKIQSWWAMVKVQRIYVIQRAAAITLQEYYRAHRMAQSERAAYLYLRAATITIQAHWKGRITMKHYCHQRLAALTIQRWYRAKLHRHEYCRLRAATIYLQCHVRAWSIRRSLRQKTVSTITIQCWWRMRIVRRTYMKMREAVLVLQYRLRARQMARLERETFLKLKAAAITLQRAFRVRRLRIANEQNNAATVIQACWRRHVTECSYKATRDAVIILQRWVRAQQERQRYCVRRTAVICVQSHVRVWLVRRRLQREMCAAVMIQAWWKMLTCRIAYRTQRCAACTIQQHYRAHKEVQREHAKYKAIKHAASTLQANWRSYCMRKEYTRTRQAAIMVQRWYRARQQCIHYRRLRQAVLCLQVHLRATLACRRDRHQYLAMQDASVVLQAAFRSWQQRLRYLVQRAAATCIQAKWRAFRQQKRYARMKWAVVLIQTRLHATIEARRITAVYAAQKQSAVTLQAVWRGLCARRDYLRRRHAVITLQAHTRRYLIQKPFKAKKAAVVSIQRWYRAHNLGKEVRRDFFITLGAVLTLQAGVRGWMVRRYVKVILRLTHAVVKIQAAVRGYQVRKRYVAQRSASIMIQRHVRAWIYGHRQYCNYHITRGACLIIQSQFRVWTQRRRYIQLRQAAITIQTHYRCACQERSYKLLKNQKQAATHIQAWFHGVRQRHCYLLQRYAAITIQAHIRGHLARRCYVRQRKSAILIQSTYRCVKAHRRFVLMRTAAHTIQCFYRAYVLRKHAKQEFFMRRNAVITIQSAYRAFTVRGRVAMWHHSATVIQAVFRAYCTRRRFMQLKAAVVIVQCHRRSQLIGRHDRKWFLVQRTAAMTIQAALREFLLRAKLRKRIVAVTAIQSKFRCFIERRRYTRMKRAVITIQRWYRMHIMTQRVRRAYTVHRKAVCIVQACVRRYLVRRSIMRQHTAATRIQTTFRSWIARKDFINLMCATIILQRRWRQRVMTCRAVQTYQKQRSSVIKIQSYVRGCFARHGLYRRQKAALCVQSVFRRYLVRRRFIRMRQAAITIQRRYRAYTLTRQVRSAFIAHRRAVCITQACVRRYLVRRQMIKKHVAATTIQTTVRSWIARKHHLHLKFAVIVIQRRWRQKVEVCQAVHVYQKKRRSAVIIQSYMRGYFERCELHRRQMAAVVVQSAFRAFYSQRVSAALVLQRRYRAYREGLRQRQLYVKTHERVIPTESHVERGERREVRRRYHAATVLQAAMRGYWCRRAYAQPFREHRAASLIQHAYRTYRVRKTRIERVKRRQVCVQKLSTVIRRYLATVRIQRTFRRYVAQKVAMVQLRAALVLQHWMRGRLDRLRYMRLRQKVIIIQRLARVYLARRRVSIINIQALVRGWLVRCRMARMVRGVVSIQSLWRGYRVRCMVKSVKLKAARRRIEAANANATEENQLGNMTTIALDYLLRCQQLSTILNALMKLDLATRWSSTCCERMAASNAAGVIFALIRSCNRSAPHMEIIKYSIEVLLNLTKYEKTSLCVFEAADSVLTLIQLLTIFREKGCIFTKSCTLLGLLCYPPRRRQAVHAMPQVVDKVRSVHALTLRKYKMEEKRNLIKTRIAASKSFSASFVGTPIVRPPLPRIEPQWLLRRESMREISDPLQATKFLMNALHLVPK